MQELSVQDCLSYCDQLERTIWCCLGWEPGGGRDISIMLRDGPAAEGERCGTLCHPSAEAGHPSPLGWNVNSLVHHAAASTSWCFTFLLRADRGVHFGGPTSGIHSISFMRQVNEQKRLDEANLDSALFSSACVVQGKEPSVRQLALLHFRNTIVLSVKLEDALSRPRARVPPSVTQMLLILQVGWQVQSHRFASTWLTIRWNGSKLCHLENWSQLLDQEKKGKCVSQ